MLAGAPSAWLPLEQLMVEKSNRVWPEMRLWVCICPTGQLGADGFPSGSSLPTCMIGRLDHMSAAVSTSPLATCFGCFAGPLFFSLASLLLLLSLSSPSPYHSRDLQKPELVSSAYAFKASLSSETLFWPLRLSMTWPTHLHLLSLPALPT